MAQETRVFINLSEQSESSRRAAKRVIRSNAARVSASTSVATRARNARFRKQSQHRSLSCTVNIVSRNDSGYGSREPSAASKDRSSEQESNRAPILTLLSGYGKSVPASASPIFYLPYLPAVVGNYLDRLAVAFPEIDGPDDKALLAKSWFPMILHSPAVFQITILFSAAHFASHSPNALQTAALLFLKQCALNGLMTLTSTRYSNDETVAAAGKMASYEAIFGSAGDYHVHMKAVERMLALRGGIEKLGLNGLLARLLLFIDTNSAYILNTHLHLEQSMLPRREPMRFLNVERFCGEE